MDQQQAPEATPQTPAQTQAEPVPAPQQPVIAADATGTPPSQPKKSNKMLFVVVVLVVLVLAGGVAALFLPNKNQQASSQPVPTQAVAKTPVPSPTETASQSIYDSSTSIDQTLTETNSDLAAYDQIDQTKDTTAAYAGVSQ